MLRLVIFLIAIAVAASGLSWLADRPGSLIVNWQGYEIETSVFRAVVILAFLVGLAVMAWSLIIAVWRSPASIGMFFNRRRQMKGLEALSGGMIAIGAGDRDTATRFAVQARKALPNEPLTQLLRAQAAQLSGDRGTARRMFEAMVSQPETEQLGLRGLFLEAEREGEKEAARQFAERSVELNPKLAWAVDALFELQCKDKNWAGALKTLSIAKKHQHHDKSVLDRRRAVLMTARAMGLEESVIPTVRWGLPSMRIIWRGISFRRRCSPVVCSLHAGIRNGRRRSSSGHGGARPIPSWHWSMRMRGSATVRATGCCV